jgi:hypothetical protein
MILRRRAALNFFTAATALVAGSCVGPPVLQQQVLGYDEVTKRLNDELLLLNVARVADDQAVHFTSTSSIAATFNWTATLGVGGQIFPQASGSTFYPFSVGGSSSENPTFSIVPLSGEASPSASQPHSGMKSSSFLSIKEGGSTRSCV